MERRGLIAAAGGVVIFAVVAVALAFTDRSPKDIEFNNGDGAREWRPTKWMVGKLSSDQRRLQLLFASGGCTRDKGRARLRESRSAVTIQVESNEPVRREGDDIACTADLRTGRAYVRLRKPLGGRDIRGSSRRAFPTRFPRSVRLRGGRLVSVVPRLVGFQASDALDLLYTFGLRAIPVPASEREREVVGTDPPQGTEMKSARQPITLITR